VEAEEVLVVEEEVLVVARLEDGMTISPIPGRRGTEDKAPWSQLDDQPEYVYLGQHGILPPGRYRIDHFDTTVTADLDEWEALLGVDGCSVLYNKEEGR